MSSPMLDVNSGTSWLSGQNDGQADHPDRAQHRAREAAEAADHRRWRPAGASRRPGRSAAPRREREVHRAEEHAAEAGDEPAHGEGDELRPRRRHGHGRRRELVLAHADDHAPDAGAPEVADEQQHEDEHEQHEVVVRAVAVGELERPEVGARDLDRRAPGDEDRPAEDVRLRGDRERERADREQQPADAQGPDARRSPRPGSRTPRRGAAPTGTRCSAARRRGTGCRASRC